MTEEGEQSFQIRAFTAGLEEALYARLDTLTVYLKRYAHLFVKYGHEGEIVPTFHFSKTTDLDSTSDLIPILHRHAPNL